MKLPLSVLALALAAAMPMTACAQVNAQSGNGPSPEQRAAMEQARNTAKTSAMNDLSADHRAKVQAILDKANNAGSMSDLVDDAKQIDGILTPDESKAILGERDKLVATMQANRPAEPGAGQGGPGAGGGHRRGGGMTRGNDAGRFLIFVSMDPQKMRDLRHKQQQAQPQN